VQRDAGRAAVRLHERGGDQADDQAQPGHHGRGAREPIADNASDAGRAQNRRVEIYVGERPQG